MNAPRRNAGFRQCQGGHQVNIRESLPTARPFSYAAALSYPTSKTRLHRRSVTAFRRSQLAGDLMLPARLFFYDAALSSAGTTGCALHGISLFPAATIARTAPSSRSVDALRRSELVRDKASEAQPDLADKALKASRTSGFALLGESLFPSARTAGPSKVTKNTCPCTGLGVPGSPRSTPLFPSLLRGSPRKGHPCRRRPRPFTAFAASMPLTPLRSDSIRPPERGVRSCLKVRSRENLKSVSTQPQSAKRNSVGWKTAKHFPPRPISQLISDLAHQKRWVSFALPTLRSLPARPFFYDAALSSAGTTGFALHGASLFLVWPRKSNQKEGHPYIRVLLRKTPLFPAPVRGTSRRDIHVPSLLARHPCLASPCAAPTLGLLKGTMDRVVWKFWNSDSYKTPSSFDDEQTLRRRRTPLSEGRMESARRGASGMDAARGVKGRGRHRHGWPLYAGPRSGDEMREVERSETRMQGRDLLVPFGATAKRDSPSRAKPMPWPTSAIGPKPQAKKCPQASSLVQNPAASPAPGFPHPVAPHRDSNEKRPLVCA